MTRKKDEASGSPPQQPKKPGPGRPRKPHAEHEADLEREQQRRIPASFEGRMKFRPGKPHALDVEFKEAHNLRLLIIEEIAQLNALLADLVDQGDPSEAISREEQALKAFLWQHYYQHKHRDHIIASFLAMRRRRLYARLQAAHEAMCIASELLTPDDRILKELRRALHQQEEEPAAEDQESDTTQPQQQITDKHIYGDAAGLRAQLATFDQRMTAIRATIRAGIGWFEEFYIKKWRANPDALGYLARGEPLPDDVPAMIPYELGPYLKYRWRESGYSRAYTISMGLIPDDELFAEQQRAALLGEEDEEP